MVVMRRGKRRGVEDEENASEADLVGVCMH